MGPAISQVLTQVYPNVKQNIQITPGVTFPNNEYGIFSTLRQFASFVQSFTAGYGSPDYPGISISIQGGQFYIYDGTQTTATKALVFTDFVGQPTWIAAGQMQVVTVMRADIQISNQITMPKGLQDAPGAVTGLYNLSSPQPPQYQSGFQGNFFVAGIRHIGNLRDTSGESWVTVLNCVEAA